MGMAKWVDLFRKNYFSPERGICRARPIQRHHACLGLTVQRAGRPRGDVHQDFPHSLFFSRKLSTTVLQLPHLLKGYEHC